MSLCVCVCVCAWVCVCKTCSNVSQTFKNHRRRVLCIFEVYDPGGGACRNKKVKMTASVFHAAVASCLHPPSLPPSLPPSSSSLFYSSTTSERTSDLENLDWVTCSNYAPVQV
ncbi:unnamed protein product [Lota lota]